MPGSKRTFTYTLRPAPEEVEKVGRQARKVLAWACEGDKRIECHDVSGEAFGVVTLNLTVRARDQWANRQLVQDILNYVSWGISNPIEFQLQSNKQPPHMVRGYAGGRTKTWKDPKPQGEVHDDSGT